MPDQPSPRPAATRRIPLAIGAVLVGGRDRLCRGLWLRRAQARRKRRFRLRRRGRTGAQDRAAGAWRGGRADHGDQPLKLPDLAFEDAEGKPRKLSEWRGKTVLVNLWATWCVPCRKEMPALDSLQTKLGGKDFEVVAINIDTRDPEKPRNFLKDANLTRLGYFTDTKAKVFQDLKNIGKALGMPTSVLVDGQGCEIANLAGPAEWASDDAIALIKAAVKPAMAGFWRPLLGRRLRYRDCSPTPGARDWRRRQTRLSARAGSGPRISRRRYSA